MKTPSRRVPNPNIPLTIGTELLMEVSELKLKMRSELIGGEAQKYIIVKLPDDGAGHGYESIRKSAIVVRYLHKGSVYGFKSKVVSVSENPSRLLFLEYPVDVEEFNVRNNTRYECVLPGSAVMGNERIEMVILDISRQGYRAIINASSIKDRQRLIEETQIDKNIQISLHIPGAYEMVSVGGVVKNFTMDGDRIIIGVMLKDISESAEERLNGFLSLISTVRPGETAPSQRVKP